MKLHIFGVIIITLIIHPGCTKTNNNTGSQEWDSFVKNFIIQYYEFNPVEAVDQGRHEFDGSLPDLSRDGINQQIKWLHQQRDKAAEFDTSKLNSKQEFLHEYFLAVVDKNLFWLETAERPFRNPSVYTGAINPAVYLTRNYAPLKVRMKAYTKYASGVPVIIEQMKKNLQLPLPSTFADLGSKAFNGYAYYFRNDVPGIFSSVKDSNLQNEFRNANQLAINAVEDAGKWFEEQKKNANGSFALGRDLYEKLLWQTERVEVSTGELLKIAHADLERNLNLLKEACGKFAPGKSIEECVLMVNKNKPEGGPVKKAREQLNELKEFVIKNNIVSIPGEEEAKVEEAPSYRRWNSAYISIPGPYETNLPSVYYIAPPDPNWTKQEQEAYIPGEKDLLFTSIHEVWPGHFLQYLHSNRIPNEFQQNFVGYAFFEGWAHYTEEMMWNEGLHNDDPEVHIGQLLNALLRDIRFISSIKLHTAGMTVEESEKMFREKAYQDPGNAKQQAARGTFDPAYLNYTLGKLMIMKLKDDWLKINNNKGIKEFHNKFLSFGGPPIPLVRKAMLGNKDDGKLFRQ